jgi:phosphoglycolate phosphatase-like HAD superfamily hydrolase
VTVARHQTAFLFDLDGTLVDSVYQHVLAWREALEQEGIELSIWRIHPKIGMSGGLFTNMLLRETGLDIDQARIERLRRLHTKAFNARSCRVRPLPGAPELLSYLTRTGISWAIATSGRMETAGPALDSLEVDLAHIPVITRDLVERAKPDPDLFLAAADALEVDITTTCVVGDSIWDMLAARPSRCARCRAPVRRIRPRRTGTQQRLSCLRGPGRFAATHRRSRRSGLKVSPYLSVSTAGVIATAKTKGSQLSWLMALAARLERSRQARDNGGDETLVVCRAALAIRMRGAFKLQPPSLSGSAKCHGGMGRSGTSSSTEISFLAAKPDDIPTSMS